MIIFVISIRITSSEYVPTLVSIPQDIPNDHGRLDSSFDSFGIAAKIACLLTLHRGASKMSNQGIPSTGRLGTILDHLFQSVEFALALLVVVLVIGITFLIFAVAVAAALHSNKILEFGNIVGRIVQDGMTDSKIEEIGVVSTHSVNSKHSGMQLTTRSYLGNPSRPARPDS
jgi:hypothetical protein